MCVCVRRFEGGWLLNTSSRVWIGFANLSPHIQPPQMVSGSGGSGRVGGTLQVDYINLVATERRHRGIGTSDKKTFPRAHLTLRLASLGVERTYTQLTQVHIYKHTHYMYLCLIRDKGWALSTRRKSCASPDPLHLIFKKILYISNLEPWRPVSALGYISLNFEHQEPK